MTTEVMTDPNRRRRLRRWIRKTANTKGARVIGNLIAVTVDAIVDGYIKIIVIAFIGATILTFGVYGINAAQTIGTAAAWLCIENGSCDLNTNLVSLAFSFYLVVAIAIYILTLPVFATKTGSLYHDVRDEVLDAEDKGISPVTISKRTGHSLTDVHTMLGYLFDDGEVEPVEGLVKGRKQIVYRRRVIDD